VYSKKFILAVTTPDLQSDASCLRWVKGKRQQWYFPQKKAELQWAPSTFLFKFP